MRKIKRRPGIEIDPNKLNYLVTHSLVYSELKAIDGFGVPILANKWHLSDTGRRYIAHTKAKNQLLLLKSLWLPIIVSIVTTVLLNTAIWLFRLQGWIQ